jgi:hypothetical protein
MVTVCAFVPRYLIEALDGRAAYLGCSRNQVVRTIVEAWVQREPPPAADGDDAGGEGSEDPLEMLKRTFYVRRYHMDALDWQGAVLRRSRGEVLRTLVRAWADRQPLPRPATDPETGELQIRAHIL